MGISGRYTFSYDKPRSSSKIVHKGKVILWNNMSTAQYLWAIVTACTSNFQMRFWLAEFRVCAQNAPHEAAAAGTNRLEQNKPSDKH